MIVDLIKSVKSIVATVFPIIGAGVVVMEIVCSVVIVCKHQ